MFDAAYHDLEDCLNNYLLRKKSGGWSKAVMTFKRDKLGIIATKKNVSFLLNQAKAFSDTLYAPLYWMPCAAGSSLKDNLEAFMLKYEGSIPPQLPND